MGELQSGEYQYPSEFREALVERDKKIVLDEGKLADIFIRATNMRRWHGQMYNDEGPISDEDLKENLVHLLITEYNRFKRIYAEADSIAKTIYYLMPTEEIKVNPYHIHLVNGTINMESGEPCFKEEMEFSPYRLPVRYDPAAKAPASFLKWLRDLLEEEDIPAFQEMLGYFLLPTTKGQKAFFLIGEGGTGKSILSDVLVALLGDAFTPIQLWKLEGNEGRFALPALENQLVAYDDDMASSKMTDTSTFKQIVTAKTPLLFERKGKDSYKHQPYARLVGSGNFNLGSLHDKTEGYYRRLLVFGVRSKPANRVDDPFLGDKIRREAEGILLWSLIGLERLLANSYRFSESPKMRELLERIRRDDDPLAEFIEDKLIFFSDTRVERSETWKAYKQFCRSNDSKTVPQKTFFDRIEKECKKHGGDLRKLSGTWTFLGMKLREVDSGIRIKGVTR